MQHLHEQGVGVDHRLVGPAEGDDVELALDALRRLLAARGHAEVRPEAGARPHRRDRLAELLLVDERVALAVDLEREAVGIAGIGQELLGAVQVEGQALVLRGLVAGDRRGDEGAGIARQAAHGALVHRVDVDGAIERLADPDVLEGVFVLDVALDQLVAEIEREEHRAQFVGLQHLDVRRGGKAGQVLQRSDVGVVDLTRQQRRDAGRGRGDRRELDHVDIVLGLVPPAGVLDEDRLGIGAPALDLERAGAVGVVGGVALHALAGIGREQRVVRLHPFLVEDEDVGEVVQQQRIRAVDLELDRVVVDLLRRLIGRQIALERRGLVGDARQRGEDIVGGEGVAVMEFDALAQLEAPDGRRHRLPGFRQRRLDLEIAGVAHQPLIDVIQHGQRESLAIGIGIERGDLA